MAKEDEEWLPVVFELKVASVILRTFFFYYYFPVLRSSWDLYHPLPKAQTICKASENTLSSHTGQPPRGSPRIGAALWLLMPAQEHEAETCSRQCCWSQLSTTWRYTSGTGGNCLLQVLFTNTAFKWNAAEVREGQDKYNLLGVNVLSGKHFKIYPTRLCVHTYRIFLFRKFLHKVKFKCKSLGISRDWYCSSAATNCLLLRF